MLNAGLISEYALHFFGYGRRDAEIWFIGMEESGGGTKGEVERRLNEWDRRGRRALESIYEFLPACGIQRWHGPDAPLQATWGGLFRLLLLAGGEPALYPNLKQYQQTRMDEICLVELLALPSPNTRQWNYKDWTNIGWLKNREAYLEHASHKRAKVLQRRILEHKPRVVVFYGINLLKRGDLFKYWEMIAGGPFGQGVPGEKLFKWRENRNTLFIHMRHPAWRKSNQEIPKIAKELLRKHRGRFQPAEIETKLRHNYFDKFPTI